MISESIGLHRRFDLRGGGFVAASLAVLLITGCGGGGGGHTLTRLSGIVSDISTASPVVGAQVTVDGTNRGTLTTERGSFFLDSVDVGRGWRTIRAAKTIAGESWSGERAVLFDPDVPIQNNLLITLAPAARKGTIRGRVSTAAGAALQNVSVFLNPDTNVAAAFRITDAGGQYEFRSVPAGTYSVVASARDLVNTGASQVVLTAGATATVDLSMLASSGTSIGAPASLQATALTYPDTAVSTQAQVRAVEGWLRARRSAPGLARARRHFRVQDWPPGSIIEIDLSWVPPSATDVAGYVLERGIGGGLFGTIDRFADPTATAYSDLDPIYTADQAYAFRLSTASTSGVQSAASNTASAQPLAPLGGLSPGNAAAVTGPPSFAWQAVPRAQRYQVLVLSRPPDFSNTGQMPLVWPSADNLAPAQTAGTQLTYSGPALQPGVTYYWLVIGLDQPNAAAAQAVSVSRIQSFTAR